MFCSLYSSSLLCASTLQVSVVVSGTQVELWVDCSRVYRRLAPPPMTNLTALASLAPPVDPSDPTLSQDPTFRDAPMALYLGQRNAKHFLFKVRAEMIFV